MNRNSKRGLAGVLKIMANRQRRREQWREEAVALWERWRLDPLFMLGIGLYWGEGSKTQKEGELALSNSDAGLLRVWLAWCERFLPGVPLTFLLQIHDTCDSETAQSFWKQELGIAVTWMRIAVSSASKRKRRSLPHGTLRIRAGRGSLEWFTKMLVWLELAQGL